MVYNAVKPLDQSVFSVVLEHCPLISAALLALVTTMTILIENQLKMLFRERLDHDLSKTTSRANWSTHYLSRPLAESALGEGPYMIVARKLVSKSGLISPENLELVTKFLAANDRALALLGGNK